MIKTQYQESVTYNCGDKVYFFPSHIYVIKLSDGNCKIELAKFSLAPNLTLYYLQRKELSQWNILMVPRQFWLAATDAKQTAFAALCHLLLVRIARYYQYVCIMLPILRNHFVSQSPSPLITFQNKWIKWIFRQFLYMFLKITPFTQ